MPRLGILVVLLCLLLPGVAEAATGSLTVHVVGGAPDAKVTGTRISCGTDCSDDASWNSETQLAPKNMLTAVVPAGFSVAWSGDCTVVASNPLRCEATYGDLEFSDGTNVTATFTDVGKPTIEEVLAPRIDTQFGGDENILVKVRALDNASVRKVAFTLDGKTVEDLQPDSGTDEYQAIFKSKEVAHGGHNVSVVATDTADLTSTAVQIPVTVDKNPPTITISGGLANGAWHGKGEAEFTFTTGFDAARIECALAKNNTIPSFGTCTAMDLNNGRHSATPSSDGVWHFLVRVADGEGNEASSSRWFRVDTTAPDIGLEGGPSGTVVQQGKATPIRGHLTDASAAVLECRVDAGAWQNCGNQVWQAEPNAAEGVRTWEFRSTDAGGNTTTVAKSWTVDGTGPAITLADGPDEGATVAPGVHGYRVTATDAVTGVPGVLCAWDDEALEPCPFEEATSRDLAPGVHRLRVRSVDGVGNASTVTRTFTVKAPTTGGGDDGGKDADGGGTGADPNAGGGDTTKPPPSTGTTPPPPPSTGGGSPRADRTAPALTVSAPKKARSKVLRRGLALTVGCSEACAGSATLAGPKGLKGSVRISRAGRVTLKLKAAALKKALRGRKRVTLTVTVSVTDTAGNAATRKITLTATP